LKNIICLVAQSTASPSPSFSLFVQRHSSDQKVSERRLGFTDPERIGRGLVAVSVWQKGILTTGRTDSSFRCLQIVSLLYWLRYSTANHDPTKAPRLQVATFHMYLMLKRIENNPPEIKPEPLTSQKSAPEAPSHEAKVGVFLLPSSKCVT